MEKSTRLCPVHKCVRGKTIVKVQIFGLTTEHVSLLSEEQARKPRQLLKREGCVYLEKVGY